MGGHFKYIANLNNFISLNAIFIRCVDDKILKHSVANHVWRFEMVLNTVRKKAAALILMTYVLKAMTVMKNVKNIYSYIQLLGNMQLLQWKIVF